MATTARSPILTQTPHEYLAEIGRRGGKAKGKPKGFAAMTPAERKRITAKAVAARQRQRAGTRPERKRNPVEGSRTLTPKP
jgi:hypothetical protein